MVIAVSLLTSFSTDTLPFFFSTLAWKQMFMLRRASDEPTGHAAAIMSDVLVNAECNGLINASQKRLLLQQIALRLSA